MGPPDTAVLAAAGIATATAGRGSPKAAFLSQLIAERQHLATQRARRRAPLGDVLRSYDAGGRIALRRLPAGYRLSIDA